MNNEIKIRRRPLCQPFGRLFRKRRPQPRNSPAGVRAQKVNCRIQSWQRPDPGSGRPAHAVNEETIETRKSCSEMTRVQLLCFLLMFSGLNAA